MALVKDYHNILHYTTVLSLYHHIFIFQAEVMQYLNIYLASLSFMINIRYSY